MKCPQFFVQFRRVGPQLRSTFVLPNRPLVLVAQPVSFGAYLVRSPGVGRQLFHTAEALICEHLVRAGQTVDHFSAVSGERQRGGEGAGSGLKLPQGEARFAEQQVACCVERALRRQRLDAGCVATGLAELLGHLPPRCRPLLHPLLHAAKQRDLILMSLVRFPSDPAEGH